MNLLEWVAKEIKKRIPRYERLRPMTKGWRSKTIGHKEEGAHRCWFETTNLHSEKPYFVLTFGNRNSDKRVRVNILPWEEKEGTPDKILKLMRRWMADGEGGKKIRQEGKSPFISNPLYVSDQLPVKDIEALIALHLLQEGESAFYGSIEEWLRNTFPREMRRIEDPSILIEYLRDHFNIQEHWLGLRGYLKKAIKKFVSKFEGREITLFPLEDEGGERDSLEEISDEGYKESYGIEGTEGQGNEIEDIMREDIRRGVKGIIPNISGSWGVWKDDETGRTWYTVERTTELTDVPKITLYRWIKNGKVKAVWVNSEGKKMVKGNGVIFVDKEEVKKAWNSRNQRRQLLEHISKERRIKKGSAQKRIKRMENKKAES